MKRWHKYLLALGLALAPITLGSTTPTPVAAATATTKVPLPAGVWTSLGVGPLLLSGSGVIVYAVSDTTPTIPFHEGFPVPANTSVTVNTTSTVWAMSGNPGYPGNAYVAPILAQGGAGGSATNDKTLAATGVPMIFPSSGTMGNNGALTMTTALDQTRSKAYVYVPLGAISAGSAAGWYYATCSSVTACTLFNNVYTSGTTAVPATPTPFATTGPGAYAQTTTAITSFNINVPGGTFGPYDGAVLQGVISYPNNANSKLIGGFFGNLKISNGNFTATAVASGVGGFRNLGVTNLQGQMFSFNNWGYGAIAAAPTLGTNDTTTSVPLFFQLTKATATDYIIVETALAAYMPKGIF